MFSLTVPGSGGPSQIRAALRAAICFRSMVGPGFWSTAGGGTFERMGRLQLDLSELDQIFLTHLHIDHSSDLPAVIMHLYKNNRTREMSITGPAGRPGNADAPENAAPQPGVDEFVRLLSGTAGAWRYMNTFEGFHISPHEVLSDPSQAPIQRATFNSRLRTLGVSIAATAVPHGMMPSVPFVWNLRGTPSYFPATFLDLHYRLSS